MKNSNSKSKSPVSTKAHTPVSSKPNNPASARPYAVGQKTIKKDCPTTGDCGSVKKTNTCPTTVDCGPMKNKGIKNCKS